MRLARAMRRRAMLSVAAWCIAAVWTGCLVAEAQPTRAPDDDIIVNIEPRYLTAYRDGSWVPVDVVIRNDKRDINGWVELRRKAGDVVQSPIYRVPADLPKGSTKRFRLHCQFAGTTRIEVMLYGERRAELSLPMRMDLRPIAERDMLCLILNDEPGAFGYLIRVAQEATGGGFYHDTLDSSMLPLMPDHDACYDSYNAVIMGEIDPERIPTEAREALTSYVARGGTLIIATGADAVRYRGSWVESLGDVRIGEPTAWNEQALAAAAFPPELQAGASPVRECLAAPLTPGEGCTQVVGGEDARLAVVRPLGAGVVATVAVGPKDEALRQCAGLQELWRDLLTMHRPGADLRIAEAATVVTNELPGVAGIRIVPRSIVVTYLALYLLVGVALNWTIWTVLRRREMAWVTLVVVSIGFTTFAVIYGSAGRLSAAELYEYRVVEAPAHDAPARQHALTGILAGRSASYDLDVALDRGLVQEASGVGGGMAVVAPRSLFATAGSRPVQWLQGDAQMLDGVGLGASEARVIIVQGAAEPLGRASANLGLSYEEGPPQRFVVNWTGPPLEQPTLYVAGVGYQLQREDDAYVVAMGDQYAAPPYGYIGWGAVDDSYLLRNIQRAVVGCPSYGFGVPFGTVPVPLETSRKAYLTGWISGDEAASALVASSIENRNRRTLVVAEVADTTPSDRELVWLDVRAFDAAMGMFAAPDMSYPLPMLPGGEGMAGLPGMPPMPMPMAEEHARELAAMGFGGRAFLCRVEVHPWQGAQVRVLVPQEYVLDPSAELSLWLAPLSSTDDVEAELVLVKAGLPDFPLVGARDADSPESPFGWGDLDERLYRPTRWRDYYDQVTGEIQVRVKRPSDTPAPGQQAPAALRLAASVSHMTTKLRSAAWRELGAEASGGAEEERTRDGSDE